MSVLLGTLGLGRKQAEARMTETVEIYAESETTDPDTLEVVTVKVQHYLTDGEDGGVARIKYGSVVVSDVQPAGQLLGAQQVGLSLPVGTGSDVLPQDVVECTASTADAGLVGRKYRVKGRPQSGQVTASRFVIEQLS